MKTSRPYNDEAYLREFREDDHIAFTHLYREYHGELYLYAYRLTGEEDLASDIVQEVFITIWEKRHELSIRTSLQSYLYRAVRNKFLNLRDHDHVKLQFAKGFQEYLSRPEITADRITERELSEYLRALIANMPERMGQVFTLRQENMPDDEIANRLGISQKTVRNLMSASLKKLQLKLRYLTLILF